MAQKALFKRELGLDDSRIMTYSVTQNTMRSELDRADHDGTGRALLSEGNMLNRLLLFVMAACLGTLFLKMELPIPYLLGRHFAAVACKIAGSPVTWPKNWRELGLLVAGYGIGRNFTADTWEKMTHQTFGVLEATLIAVAVAVLIAWWTARHTSANLISCVMGIMPGGLTQMMLMSEDDQGLTQMLLSLCRL